MKYITSQCGRHREMALFGLDRIWSLVIRTHIIVEVLASEEDKEKSTTVEDDEE
jgi:hypothetical protein